MSAASWRDTLFVWDGILVDEGEDEEGGGEEGEAPRRATWSGTWVGAEGCPDARTVAVPRRGAFDELVRSETRFDVGGTAVPSSSPTSPSSVPTPTPTPPGGGGDVPLLTLSLTSGPGWDLEAEDGTVSQHTDTAHDVLLPSLRWSGNTSDPASDVAVGKGTNQHGAFVSAGFLRVGNRLTLARRYLAEDDRRTGWELEELRREVLAEVVAGAGEGGGGGRRRGGTTTAAMAAPPRVPPWQCGAMHSHGLARKRRRTTSEKGE